MSLTPKPTKKTGVMSSQRKKETKIKKTLTTYCVVDKSDKIYSGLNASTPEVAINEFMRNVSTKLMTWEMHLEKGMRVLPFTFSE